MSYDRFVAITRIGGHQTMLGKGRTPQTAMWDGMHRYTGSPGDLEAVPCSPAVFQCPAGTRVVVLSGFAGTHAETDAIGMECPDKEYCEGSPGLPEQTPVQAYREYVLAVGMHLEQIHALGVDLQIALERSERSQPKEPTNV